ncbi:hypothetical protein [Polymorphospora rubra]|uniref:Uncharacterized protein n=1 Tax=Polymorphospora rubra TaxID=338584 RepID=A0A810N2F8_9ACTN|nr:hypothetical protein [Polymorphospora rubra]BCJ65725.1 hypothetical protein Prubr_27460 [Polymorphospora rubra]
MSRTVQEGMDPLEPNLSRDPDEALKELVARADLTDIRVTKWHAELLADEPIEVSELDLKVWTAFRYRASGFDIKYGVEAPLVSPGSDEEVASIQMDVVASFSLTEGERPERELLGSFMDQVAFFVVMPFIREGLHSLSTRIGLEPITLGLLHQGKGAPATAWTSKHQFQGVPLKR